MSLKSVREYGANGDEIIGKWMKIYNVELQALKSLPNTELPNTKRAYRWLSLTALAYLLAGQRGVILTLLPNTHAVISVYFPGRWSRASTYICKAETLAFTDCNYC